jgi:hypothetical protein
MLEIQQKMQQVIGAAGIEFPKPTPKAEEATISGTAQKDLSKPLASADREMKGNTGSTAKSEPVNSRQASTEANQSENQKDLSVESGQTEARANTRTVEHQNKVESSSYGENSRTYQGKLKIDIAPPVDNNQLNLLESTLLKTSGLRIIGKGIMEDGSAWIEIDAAKPLPLVEIIKKVPSVKDVVGAKSYIIIALRAKQMS